MPSEPNGADDARLLDWFAAGDAQPGAMLESAMAALMRMCPIVTGLLAFDGRLEAEVTEAVRPGGRRESIAAWGLQFASRLESDADPWIAWAAQVDASTLVVERSRRNAEPPCPGDPMRAILLITSGTDPRKE